MSLDHCLAQSGDVSCDFCELRAAFVVAGTDQKMCPPCAMQWAGLGLGRATAARDQLSAAVA